MKITRKRKKYCQLGHEHMHDKHTDIFHGSFWRYCVKNFPIKQFTF